MSASFVSIACFQSNMIASAFARRLSVVSFPTNTKLPATASKAWMSTYPQTGFTEVEGMMEKRLHRLHWKDAEDELKEIKHFMEESKTNHAIKTPTPEFESLVTKGIDDVEYYIKCSNHQEVASRVHNLKTMVKKELYN